MSKQKSQKPGTRKINNAIKKLLLAVDRAHLAAAAATVAKDTLMRLLEKSRVEDSDGN